MENLSVKSKLIFFESLSPTKKKENILNELKTFLNSIKNGKTNNVFTILGASGDLAKKKIYPALWLLYKDGLLPERTFFLGYSRTSLDISEFLSKHVKVNSEDKDKFESFIKLNYHLQGAYDKRDDFKKLNTKILDITRMNMLSDENTYTNSTCNRIFYLAIPPFVYESALEMLSLTCKASVKGFTRVIIEKPFGKDLVSSNNLCVQLNRLFDEKEIYRIDHYLGKEMVQNLLVLRFSNIVFNRLWNRDSIECVMITFKESVGVEGRGGYFDQYGIIRDVMQNHLLQILSLIAMERPISNSPDDIRNEKIKVLKKVSDLTIENVVLGQYIGNKNGTLSQVLGYLDDPSVVDKTSLTPTYACAILNIENERWKGVPFILKSGKALNERKAEIRVQFKDVPGDIFDGSCQPNELVIRVQPDEAIYFKFNTKKPGMNYIPIETELDLTYRSRYEDLYMPDAYERLLLDIFVGNQTNFVSNEELTESWRIFSPLLKYIDENKVVPIPYEYGNRSLPEADELCKRLGKYFYRNTYSWKSSK